MKKTGKYLSLVFGLFIILNSRVNLLAGEDMTFSFCEQSGILKAFRLIGYFVLIAKIVIPAILIITGIRLLLKTLFDEKADIKKAVFVFIQKFVLGVFIFFIPLIVNTVFSFVDAYTESESKFHNCTYCMTYPNRSDCTSKIKD